MTVLEQKEAIREVIDRFSTLEIDVKEQAKLFTPDSTDGRSSSSYSVEPWRASRPPTT